MREKILIDRENRYNYVLDLLSIHKKVILCARINYPGLFKRTPESRIAFDYMIKAVKNTFQNDIVALKFWEGFDGWSMILLLDEAPFHVKKLAINLEENHGLGRLFDLDVIGTNGLPVSRTDLGEESRKCIICHKIALECMITNSHTSEETIHSIHKMIREYDSCDISLL